MDSLLRKTALVTGVSRGIGTYIVKSIINEGVRVIGVARSQNLLMEMESDIRKIGGMFHSLPFDLCELKKINQLIKKVNKISGNGIDILVHNAGVEKYNQYSENSLELIQSIFKVNLIAPMEITRLILPQMLKQESGHIVNIASLAGRKGVAYNSIYSASKAGMIKWGDGLRQELHGTGVNISTIMPGFIANAGMFYDGGQKAPKFLGTSEPQDVADAVITAIKSRKSEIIVNKGPMKPLLALNVFSADFGDFVLKKLGVVEMSKKRMKQTH